jgi:ParB family chromosome partitioning protein
VSETTTASRRRKFSVDALFTDTSARAVGVSDLVEARAIRLDRIEPDPNQPRRTFDDGALEDLAGSIRAEGVLQPIAVHYDAARDVYVVIHGERRWRAARMAGLDSIPAIVRDVPEGRRLVQQLIENVVREDLNALDRAAALRALKQQMDDASWEQVAAAVGIRRSRLFQLLGTEKLNASLQDALRRGIISEKQTRQIQQLPLDVQQKLGNALLAEELTPRMLAAVVRDLKSARQSSSKPSPVINNHKHATRLLQQMRAVHASIDQIADNPNGGLPPRTAHEIVDEMRALHARLGELLAAIDAK